LIQWAALLRPLNEQQEKPDMKKPLIAVLLATGLLYGCASPSVKRAGTDVSAGMGGAGYDYHRIETTSSDGTKRVETRIRSTSQRDVTKGSVVVNGTNGSFRAEVAKTEGNVATTNQETRAVDAAASVVGKALDKIPGQ